MRENLHVRVQTAVSRRTMLSKACALLAAAGVAQAFVSPAHVSTVALRTSSFTQASTAVRMGAKGEARLQALNMKLGDAGEPVRCCSKVAKRCSTCGMQLVVNVERFFVTTPAAPARV
jgi:hypothetical protein